MKNKVADVRNHLVMVMESLNNEDATPEQAASAIERAKAMSLVTSQYIAAVKVELDAIKLFDETQLIPASIERPALEGR